MNADARYMSHLLDCLHQRRAPDGGLAFAAVWGKLDLDYRPDSLTRIAAFLRRVHAKQGNDAFGQLESSRSGQNFLLTLAAYLAEYVSRHSGADYDWQDGEAVFDTHRFKPLPLLRRLLEGRNNGFNLDAVVWQLLCSAPVPDVQKMAAFLPDCYRRRRNLPNGLAFAGVPAALSWRGSKDDLPLLDAELARLHHSEGLNADNFRERFAGEAERNFLLLLAFYLGEIFSGGDARWYGLPADGDALLDLAVLDWNGNALPLMRLLADALCGIGIRFSEWAANPPLPPDPNDAARRAIDAVRLADTEALPFAFAEELAAIEWDYSLGSLHALDALLDDIRGRVPDFDMFVREAAALNFLHFCAFYLARAAAEYSHNTLYFLDYEQAREQVPDLPRDWFSQYAARIGDKIYFPFGRIASRIWDHSPEEGCADFARMLRRNERGSLYRCPQRKRIAPAADSPDLAHKTIRQAGFAAAYALHCRRGLPEQAVFPPMLLLPHPEKHWDLRQLMFDSADEAVAHGQSILAHNPDNLPCAVLVYEGYVHLPRGRFDAVMLDIRSYRGNKPLSVQAAIPMRPNADGTWSVGTPVFHGNAFANEHEALAAAAQLYRGMGDFEQGQAAESNPLTTQKK